MIETGSSGVRLSPLQQQLLERMLRGRQAEIPRLQRADRQPLGPAQARIWFVCRMYPASAEYNVLGPPLTVPATVDRDDIAAALRTLLERHDALRLRIVEVGETAMQEVAAGLEPPLAWDDLSALPGDAAERRAAEIANHAARTPFALDAAPLFRVVATRRPDRTVRVIVIAHHIIVDGAAIDVLYDELHALLEGRALAPPPEVGFLDYTAWERSTADDDRLANQLGYWRHKLATPLPMLDVPKDRPWVKVRSRKGHAVPLTVPATVMHQVRELASVETTTVFVILLAAYKALLLRLTGQPDVIVGTPLIGRDHPAAERLVGSFARIVPLRTDLGGDPSFRELVRRVRATVIEAQDHQQVAFERIVAELRLPRDLNSSPIFQTVFAVHGASGVLRGVGAANRGPVCDSETAKWELGVSLVETADATSGFLEYASDLYDEATVARYAGHYNTLLENLVGAPDRAVARQPLLSAAEREHLLHGLRSPIRVDPPYTTLAGPFEDQVARTPSAVALVGEEGTLTYRELDERANRLAHVLRRAGLVPGGWVAVCMERSFSMVIAVYAIAKVGAAYVPLDPEAPAGRLQFQLEDTASQVVVTHARTRDLVPPGPWRTICVDDIAQQLAEQPAHAPPAPRAPELLAYLMYTSGSTGRPKAVAFPVSAALSSVYWIQREFPVAAGDRHLLKTPYTFDVSLWELCWPLYFGGTLVIARHGGHADPRYLAEVIERHDVMSICVVPSILQALLDVLEPGRCRSLRWIHIGGEAVPPRLRDACYAKLDATLINGCGPTETHAVAQGVIPRDDSTPRVQIGRPLAAFRAYVLDGELEPQPIGVPGELYVGGEVGLAHGYHRRAALTAERFLPDPFGPPGSRMYRTGDLCRYDASGVLEHLGRCDTQVKVAGVRMEPAEIESVLCEHAAVTAAVVLAIANDAGTRLVGFVVPDGELDARDVLAHAARILPRHMVPSSLVAIERIPTTANGKLDREALLARWRTVEVDAQRIAVEPEGEPEQRMAGIFARVLGVERVSVTATFFELGGHSLLIFRLLAACERELGVRLAVADVFAAPTVRELAARVVATTQPATGTLIPLAARPGKPLIVFVHAAGGSALSFLEVTRHLGEDYAVSAFQASEPGSAGTSIEQLAARYVTAVDAVRGVTPVILAGWSMGGCVALEMARCWQARGVSLAALVMLDAWPPPLTLEVAAERDEWLADLHAMDVLERERANLGGSADAARTLADVQQMLDAHRNAFARYTPAWFEGEVDFVCAREPFLGPSRRVPEVYRAPDRGWRRHVRSVTVHDATGDHFTMLASEHAGSLATTILRIIEARLSFGQI